MDLTCKGLARILAYSAQQMLTLIIIADDRFLFRM